MDVYSYGQIFPACQDIAWSRRGAFLLKYGVFADVCVRIDDSSFSCHKIVLASASEFFERLFKNDGLQTGEVVLEQPTPKLFKIFLDYIYTWNDKPMQNLTFQELCCLLENSHMWMAVEVKNTCEEMILDRCSTEQPKELIQLYKTAYLLDSYPIMIKVIDLMQKHPMDQPEIYDLDIDCFIEYMRHTRCDCSEAKRFRIAEMWIEKNLPEPDPLSEEVVRILQIICFQAMPLEDFYHGPGKSKLLADSRKVKIIYKIASKSSDAFCLYSSDSE
ncbi:kelch-like protein 40a [Drosophila kikkawai]|uniref:Kelch-like protein 40a n=1 Tax=Drosophila kikkawai TaxID=30033 RepID=A0A6P4HUQ9_DROKI|nr:kelch-like protein 11 [Drosophila kikkawai]XP_017019390.1 kelch-like protein 11 [Drosophila kikkawai]